MAELCPISTSSLTTSNVSLLVLTGLPASGKSKLAQSLSSETGKWHSLVLSFDDFIPLPVQAQISLNALDGDQSSSTKLLRKHFVSCVETVCKYSQGLYSSTDIDSYLVNLKAQIVHNEVSDLVPTESFVSKLKELLNSVKILFEMSKNVDFRLLIVVDDNNYYSSMRNHFYQVAKEEEIGFCVVYCKAPLKTCIQRNSQRPVESQVPPKAIVEMSVKFEEPEAMKHACDSFCVQLDTSGKELNLSVLNAIISRSFENRLKKDEDRTEEIERHRRICSESEVHQADLLLRKWISRKINLESFSKLGGVSKEGKTGENMKVISKRCNERKKETLKQLRSGDLKVSYGIDQSVEFEKEIISLFERVKIV